MGSGDLTVDSKEGLDELVNKREIAFKENGSISFYRFKIKNDEQSNFNEEEVHNEI